MAFLLLIGVILFLTLVSLKICGRLETRDAQAVRNEQFTRRLEEAGFFRGMDSAAATALKGEIARLGWPGVFAHLGRFHHADAENLAEGGFGEFVAGLTPFLNAESVGIPRIEDLLTEHGYTIKADGIEHVMYNQSELERDSTKQELGLCWGLSTARAFRLVNAWLEKAGSRERLYAVMGGNDLHGFFLTEEMYRVIVEHPDAIVNGGPYLPNEEYPWFGQPAN